MRATYWARNVYQSILQSSSTYEEEQECTNPTRTDPNIGKVELKDRSSWPQLGARLQPFQLRSGI